MRARHFGATALALVLAAAPAAAQEPETAPRPTFTEWLAGVRAEALTRGIREDVVDAALADVVEPQPVIIERDRAQAEVVFSLEKYVSRRLTPQLIRSGRDAYAANRALLDQVAERYGVPPRIIVAIWGMETRYGRATGSTPVFRALATLAWEPRRAAMFRGELFDALSMVAGGHVEAAEMTGSWAGAMGQTQFMPSNYLKYAVDFNRDGRTDIWKSTGDALASIANYLKGFGWNDKETWGREVKVPAAAREKIAESIPRRTEGCYAIRNMTTRVPLDRWRKLGVTRVDGGPLPDADVQAGLVDVGERTFLVYPNYDAILGYNCAHYYALTVSLLADRLR